MNFGVFQTALSLLPMRHKVVAALVTTSVALGACVWIALQPSEYSSSALLAFTSPDSPAQVPAPAIRATAILHAQVANGGPVSAALEGEPSDRLRKHLAISGISSSQVRLMWTGRDPARTQSTAQALAATLAAWEPQTTQANPETMASSDLKREKEASLLRVTIAVLELKRTELSAKLLQANNAKRHNSKSQIDRANLPVASRNNPQSALQNELRRLDEQRAIIQQRLAETQHKDSEAQPSVSTSDSTTQTKHGNPFLIVENATIAQPLNAARSAPEALGVLSGLALGLLYLAAALWWFRPMGDIADLSRMLADKIPVVGSIAEVHQ